MSTAARSRRCFSIRRPSIGASREQGAQRKRTLYIIRNARLDPDWASVERKTMSIAAAGDLRR